MADCGMGKRSHERAPFLHSHTSRSDWLQVGAFLPRDPDVAQRLRSKQHAVPVLMVHGSSDMLVPMERRRAAQLLCKAGMRHSRPCMSACTCR